MTKLFSTQELRMAVIAALVILFALVSAFLFQFWRDRSRGLRAKFWVFESGGRESPEKDSRDSKIRGKNINFGQNSGHIGDRQE